MVSGGGRWVAQGWGGWVVYGGGSSLGGHATVYGCSRLHVYRALDL